jgi:hypothetical protein
LWHRIARANNRVEENFIQDWVREQRAMKVRYTLWLTSLSAAVALFFGRRLKALGELIAAELERSYAGSAEEFTAREKPRPKLQAGAESPDKKKRKELQKQRKEHRRRASAP